MRPLAITAAVLLSVLVSLIAQDGPETVVRGTKQFSRSEVVTGLAGPWELTLGPDNMLWVTERTGKRITRVNPATGERKVAVTIDEVLAPGGQDGLLGLALDLGNNFVYAAYTYADKSLPPHSTRAPESEYRFLYTKLVRFAYDGAQETLGDPVTLIAGLPAGNDHLAGRLKIGPDRKLYYTIGDLGNNQLGNYCTPIEAQKLPTQAEIQAKNYAAYVGKSLRLNLDGSIPNDNPEIAGVRSHVFTYGHRNPQGIDFGPDGTLYESEHGPKTDDEINVLKAGANYGWPHVAGLKDGRAYDYARWAESTTPCAQIKFSDLAIAPTVPHEPESAFTRPFTEPIATMFTVPTGYNFSDPVCKGRDYICWPTVGVSSVEHYRAPRNGGIPGWENVLLLTTLKRGSLYEVALSPDGQRVRGPFSRYFQSENRYRDSAVSADGKTIYIATDPSGLAEAAAGGITGAMTNRGSILAFTYVGEGTGAAGQAQAPVEDWQVVVLGIAQDGGIPQLGCNRPLCQEVRAGRRKAEKVSSLGLVNRRTGDAYLFDATPDLPAQLQSLTEGRAPNGVFLTHAHIGHYTGLMFFGRESVNTSNVPVYATERMAAFLRANGPWSQLIAIRNITLTTMAYDQAISLRGGVRVTPLQVPHRDEFSDTVGFRIEGPRRTAIFIPDIDRWEKWDRNIRTLADSADYAFLDGTFASPTEINRPIEEIPHPLMSRTRELLRGARAALWFIHINNSNAEIDVPDVAREGMTLPM